MRHLLLRAACAPLVACLLWSNVGAQTSTDAASPMAPARLALAEQVIDASNMKANGEKLLEAISAQIVAHMQPTSNPEMSAYIGQVMRDELASMQTKLEAHYAEIYARTFTDQQLNELLAFYESPTGRMFVEKAPELAQQSELAIAPLLPAMEKDMVEKLFDHVCTVQKCTDQQRTAMATAKAKIFDRIDQGAAGASPQPPADGVASHP